MSYKLNIEKQFTDRENGKLYRVGEVVKFTNARGEQLLKDPRKLVSLNEKTDRSNDEAKSTNKDTGDKTSDAPDDKSADEASNTEQTESIETVDNK